MIGALDRVIGAVISAGRWLALPVVAALFLQWPLRDAVRCCSREANDLGQWIFALFIAVAVTAATRARIHLAADSHAKTYSVTTRKWIALGGNLIVLLPWSIALIVMNWPLARDSARFLERFPDTSNPGYFLIKVAALLLALLVFAQAIVDLFARDENSA